MRSAAAVCRPMYAGVDRVAGVDLVSIWYELATALAVGRRLDPASGWPLLTLREAFDLARGWGLVLGGLGSTVEPVTHRWLEASRNLLGQHRGPDVVLPTAPALWEVGAELAGHVADLSVNPWRHATGGSIRPFGPWVRNAEAVAVRFDEKGRLLVANVNDPNDLEYALRRFFIAQGRTEREGKKRDRRNYVEINIGDALQILALWDKYAATAKPVGTAEGGTWRDPRGPWREFAALARALVAGKSPTDLYPVGEVEELWYQARRLGRDLSVLKDGQPQRGWSDFVDSVKDTVKGYAGAAANAGEAVGDAAGAVARKARGLFVPLAIGVGAVAGVGLIATILRK